MWVAGLFSRPRENGRKVERPLAERVATIGVDRVSVARYGSLVTGVKAFHRITIASEWVGQYGHLVTVPLKRLHHLAGLIVRLIDCCDYYHVEGSKIERDPLR